MNTIISQVQSTDACRFTDILFHSRDDECVAVLVFTEYLVHEQAKMMVFIVIDGDAYDTVVSKQFTEKLEPWPHHAEPFVMPFQIFTIHRALVCIPVG